MIEIIGRQLEVGVAVEETRGVAPSAADAWVKNVSVNLLERAEHILDESVRGRFEDSDTSRVVKKAIEGNLEMNLGANALGYLIYNIYGTVSPSTVQTGVYDHAFSLQQSSIMPSISFYVKDGGVQQLAFRNSHINTLEVTANTDDYIRVSANVIAKDSVSNSDTPSYAADYDFIGRDITVKVAETEGGLAGATPIVLKEVNITFDKGLISDHRLGSYFVDDIYTGRMSIEGSFVKNFNDDTFKALYLSKANRYMQIVIEGEQTIGASSKPTITIILNKAQILDWTRGGGADELVTETVNFKAFYNVTDAEQSTVVIRNTIADYEPDVSA